MGFSVPGHNQISDGSGLEILKREAFTILLSSCITAGLAPTEERFDAWAKKIGAVLDARMPKGD